MHSRRGREGRVVAGHRWVLSMAVGLAIGEAAMKVGVGCAGGARAGARNRSFGVAGRGGGDEDDCATESGLEVGSAEARLLKRSGRCRSVSVSGIGGVRGVGALRRTRVAGRWIQERGEEHRCYELFAVGE